MKAFDILVSSFQDVSVFVQSQYNNLNNLYNVSNDRVPCPYIHT